MENDIYGSILTISDLNEIKETDVYLKFNSLKNEGIILNSSFDSNCWKCCDEVHTYNFRFGTDEDDYLLKDYLGMSYDKYIYYIKVFVIYLFGKINLGTIRTLIKILNKLCVTKIEDIHKMFSKTDFSQYNYMVDFISMLPSRKKKNIDKLLEIIDDSFVLYDKGSNQRLLAAFYTYFIFDEVIRDYWKNVANTKEKLFFAPLYFWWIITSIIPLRPIEFILTPRKCLEISKGVYYLKIRRNNIKGQKKEKHYKIEEDYYLEIYEIPNEIAKEIEWYIKETENDIPNELDTLFTRGPHYSNWERSIPSNTRYFTSANLNRLLRMFYINVIADKYKYRIIYDKVPKFLPDGVIQYINLGDTRHLAFVNILVDGFPLILAKTLGGHDSIYSTVHYASNIASFIECATYRAYKKSISKNQAFFIEKRKDLPFNLQSYILLENGGRCYSPKAKINDFSDCIKSVGPDAEFGNCSYCEFYWKKEFLTFDDKKDEYIKAIKKQYNILLMIIKKVRAGNGEKEEIIQQILNLQDATFSYRQYCEEKWRQEDENR